MEKVLVITFWIFSLLVGVICCLGAAWCVVQLWESF